MYLKKKRKFSVDIARRAVSLLEGAGVFAVEFFLTNNGQDLLNEVVHKKPHNSGHHTIESCYTSHNEQHLRAVIGLPLGETSMKTPAAIMYNILGEDEGERGFYLAHQLMRKALSIPGATIHLYDKPEMRKLRKMRHITLVGPSRSQVKKRMDLMLNLNSESIASDSTEMQTKKFGLAMKGNCVQEIEHETDTKKKKNEAGIIIYYVKNVEREIEAQTVEIASTNIWSLLLISIEIELNKRLKKWREVHSPAFAMEPRLITNWSRTFRGTFVQVHNIFYHNRLLITEINKNHESEVLDNLHSNVEFIKDLNNNIRRVVDLYSDLSSSFTKSMESSSDGDSFTDTFQSDTKKRIRSS